jgi:hypothetical protein
MEVQFRRTAERRYAITIYRKDLPPVEMNPAPGCDPIMPHDLLHLVVESELGLSRGIFGQVASGDTPGHFIATALRAKAAGRRRVAGGARPSVERSYCAKGVRNPRSPNAQRISVSTNG